MVRDVQEITRPEVIFQGQMRCAGESKKRRQATAMEGSFTIRACPNSSAGHEIQKSPQSTGPQLLISDSLTQRQARQTIGEIGPPCQILKLKS